MVKKRILIVDDEKDFVMLIKERLMRSGYDVMEAFDGEDGLKKAEEDNPDLIILDLVLPKLDGYAICRKLKLDEKYKKIPIIMLTAKFQPSDIKFGKDMGAEAYLTKPLESKELMDMVRQLLKDGVPQDKS